MSFRTRMKFCWRRFRHFVAAYFVLGLSATLAHGAMIFSLFDVSASEEPMSELISPEAAPLAAEEASAPEIENPPEEMVPAEEGQPAVDSVVEEAPDDTVDGAETAPEVIPAEELPGEPEPEVAPAEADAEPEATEPAEETPDSWPAEPIEPEPTTEPEPAVNEEPPPYLEARSTLESVINKIDWLYTLRSGANYDLLGSAKLQTAAGMLELADTLDAEGSNGSINTQLCDLYNGLATLNGVLAPGSDDSQPEVDSDNQEVLAEIESAISLVETMWTMESGLSAQCAN